MYYCILLGLCRSCAPRFLLCISLYVTCSMSCTFCVYVICAPSHLAPRIPFLYTVVRHTLSVCSFSTLRRFGRFASDCIDTANLPHRDFVFIHPSLFCLPSCRSPELWGCASRFRSKRSGLKSYAHMTCAFSVNWVRRADLPHILSYGVLGISSPFSLPLPHYMSFRPSQFYSCGVPSVHGLSGPAGLPLLRVFSSQFSVVECGVFVGCQCSHICVLPCTLCPLF